MATSKTRETEGERERPDVVCRDAGRDTGCMKGREIKKTDREMKVNRLVHEQKCLELVIEPLHV